MGNHLLWRTIIEKFQDFRDKKKKLEGPRSVIEPK